MLDLNCIIIYNSMYKKGEMYMATSKNENDIKQAKIKELEYENTIKELNKTIDTYKKKISELENKIMKLSKKKVERNDPIKKSNLKKPLNDYTSSFNRNLNDYVTGVYLKEITEKEKKKKYNDIYNDTGIPKSSFTNYTTDRLPRYTETLIMIKDYFDVPFSYLFGETPTTSINEININVGMAYGLNDRSIYKLRKLKKESETDSLENNYEATIKLFLINSIINSSDFLYSFARLVPTLIGRKQLDEKFKGQKNYVPFAVNKDYIDYLKYSAYEQYIDYLNKLIERQQVPESIVKNSIEIAKKYAGKRQEQIRFEEEKKK